MPKYEIVPTTMEHVLDLVETMREADKDEVWAMTRATPCAALLTALRASRDARTGLADGEVLCIFGTTSVTTLGTTGIPWMLSSNSLPKHAKAFLRGSISYIEEMMGKYDILINYVDTRNIVAKRWLKWLGFTLDPPVPFGAARLPFHRFEMRTV
jgi:hypothetical protein